MGRKNTQAIQYQSRNRRLRQHEMTYQEYLRSDLWKRIRTSFLAKKENQSCWICGSSYNLQVHHKSYRRLFNPQLSKQHQMLVSLCGGCHLSVHDICNLKNLGLGQGVRRLRKKHLKVSVSHLDK